MRNLSVYFIGVFMFAGMLTSCVTTFQTNYLQTHGKRNPAFKDSASYEDYRLKQGDRLYIQVYSTKPKMNALFNGPGNIGFQLSSGANSDLYTYEINADGNIRFPVVGDVQLQGKTLRESKRVIKKAITPLFTGDKSIDVRLIGKSFSVIGGGKSGRFIFPKEKINIYQAIAMIGDVGLYTDRSKVRILRQTKNGAVVKNFDMRKADIINSEFYYVEPDDIIFLQPMDAQFFRVTTFWSAVSTIITTISFGAGIYGIITK